jgi:hypothetical protein
MGLKVQGFRVSFLIIDLALNVEPGTCESLQRGFGERKEEIG